ncbi:MAG: DegQ family serine endoprotease [Xanthomonadales bacterium]|nr:DegQ family serine endoprotease [Xanthomonadales bacterium]
MILLSLATLCVVAAVQAQAPRVSGLPDFTHLVESAGPAVVNIRVTQFGNRVRRGDDAQAQPNEEDIPEFFRRFFDVPQDPRFGQPDRSGAGSGFIYDEDGYIITNHHVVEEADQIIVRLADRREYEAELVGSDAASDIALLKIDAEGLPALEFGSSEELRPGEWVAAIGSPFNFEQSVTAGIVSAKGRSNASQQYVPFIQTDVAINRGNSGGPLLNMAGQVVGINSWILSSSGGYIGLSFSIPIEVAASTVQQLRETGRVERGLLGVVVGAVTRELAEAMNLDRPVGALVNDVTPGGSADEAGIEPGDIILAFDGQPVETWNDLPPLVGANPPGTEATVRVSRNGEEREFAVVLDALPSDDEGALAAAGDRSNRSNALGLAVESIDPAQRSQLDDVEGGVIVTDVESDAAWRAGVRPGDVILMINNREITDMDAFDQVAADLPGNRSVALRIWRNGTSTFIAYRPAPQSED